MGSFNPTLTQKCLVPESIHTSPVEGIFLRPQPPWKFQTVSYISLNVLVLTEPPTPRNFRSLLGGGGGGWCGYLSGTAELVNKPVASVSKRVFVRNHSYENVFSLHRAQNNFWT